MASPRRHQKRERQQGQGEPAAFREGMVSVERSEYDAQMDLGCNPEAVLKQHRSNLSDFGLPSCLADRGRA